MIDLSIKLARFDLDFSLAISSVENGSEMCMYSSNTVFHLKTALSCPADQKEQPQ